MEADKTKQNENDSINKTPDLQRGDTKLAVKAGFWYVISNYITKGISFITTPIFARLMSQADYGEFSNYASWQATLLIITSGELYNTLSRAYYDYKEDYDKYASSVTIAGCLGTFLIYVLFLLNQKWIFSLVSIPSQFVHILFFTLMFQSCKMVYLTRERTLYAYKKVAVLSLVDLLIPTLISVGAVVLVEESERLGARIYGFYLPYALIGVGCAWAVFRKGRAFRLDHCRYAFKLSIPLLANYFTAYLLTSTNTIVTKSMLGATMAATVSIASSTIHLLTILFQSLSGAVTTWLMDNLEQENYQKVRSGITIYIGGVALITVGVILFAPEVIWILGGSQYEASAYLVPGLSVAATIQAISTVLVVILTFYKRVVKTAVATAVIAALSIVGKVLFMPSLGLDVLIYTNIAAYAVLLFVNYLLVKKTCKGNVVRFSVLLLSVLLLVAVVPLCHTLYMHSVIRYSVIGVMALAAALLVWKNRNELLKLLKKFLKKS